MASQAIYGAFPHPENECNLVRIGFRRQPSQRGKKMNTVIAFYLQGEIQDTGSALTTKMLALENAYKNDYGNFQYLVDGAVTHQLLSNSADCVSGVRVVDLSWSKGDGAELAVKRTYTITLQATYDTAETDLIYWQESIRYFGNCGPRYEVVETFSGPVFIQTAQSTSMKVIQTGRAVGYAAYVLPPGPYAPGNEHQDRRMVTLTGGVNLGQQSRFYTTEWQYTHSFLSYTELFPQTR